MKFWMKNNLLFLHCFLFLIREKALPMYFQFNRAIIFLVAFVVMTSISCKNVMCYERVIIPSFVGFQLNDIDTLVMKRYKANDNFRTFLDSSVITYDALTGGHGYGMYTIKNDTTLVFVNGDNPSDGVYPGYDWKIIIPAKSKTVSISNINSENNEGRRGCVNAIRSFQVDGVINNSPTFVDAGEFYTIGYRAYILP
jgi:hypothetical protein